MIENLFQIYEKYHPLKITVILGDGFFTNLQEYNKLRFDKEYTLKTFQSNSYDVWQKIVACRKKIWSDISSVEVLQQIEILKRLIFSNEQNVTIINTNIDGVLDYYNVKNLNVFGNIFKDWPINISDIIGNQYQLVPVNMNGQFIRPGFLFSDEPIKKSNLITVKKTLEDSNLLILVGLSKEDYVFNQLIKAVSNVREIDIINVDSMLENFYIDINIENGVIAEDTEMLFSILIDLNINFLKGEK